MKSKRRRAIEVPPKIRSFINRVTTAPSEQLEENLKNFVWQYDKGDFHHWVDLFNHFDSFFEKHIKSRKDSLIEDNFLGCDPPFPREAVLQILRVTRIILENCTNKHFYSSYEQHLSALLASTDADVVEACLQTLAAFFKKAVGKYSIRDAALISKFLAFAQGWGGKEEGLGLVACAVQNGCDKVAYDLGCTLHFEFYAAHDSSNQVLPTGKSTQGLQIIHLPNVNSCHETVNELFNKLVMEYKVPMDIRFLLLTRLRFARAFHSLSSRQQYTCIRLYAFVVLIQSCGDADELTSFFNNEPEFISELVSILSCEELIPEKIRILSLLSLVALCHDRCRQPAVLAAVTSGRHRGILSGLIQKAIDSVITNASKSSVVFSEALLSLITILVSSSSGCSAMREAGFIPTLLPLLKNTDHQHLHLVSSAVHVLEAFIDYSNPGAALFRDLGGLDDAISRLKIEVSYVENCPKQQQCDDLDHNRENAITVSGSSAELDNLQPLYSEALVACHRRLLIKALLRAISLGTYAPGSTTHIYGSEESLLPHCLCIIFRRAKDFGGGVFSLAATVMSDLIQKDPTHFPVLEASGLPSAFLDAIIDGVVCSAEAIICIPQCLDALCLNNNGLQAVKDHNALRSFVKVFTSKAYSRALTGETVGSLSSGLDELMRHASSLRGPGVDMLIEILNSILSLGSGTETTTAVNASTPSMETDVEEKILVQSNDKEKLENSEPNTEQPSSRMDAESFLPECLSNAARLLETILQNADTCRMFVEKKGIDAVLQLFNFPLMPLSMSIGQSMSVAFKNFSLQHSASLARAVCSFLKEQLKLTNELLEAVRGTQLVDMDADMQMKILRSLYSLEGILSLSTCLLKGSASIVSELSTADADALKDLGRVYGEVLWQISLSSDSKLDDKKIGDLEPESADAASSAAGRETDDDVEVPVVRYMNPMSVRNSSLPHWGGEREFLSVVRSGEGLHRRSRHGLSRIRSGRAIYHLESLNVDPEVPSHPTGSASPQDMKKKSPHALLLENLNRLASTFQSFFSAIVKGFASPNRRRTDSGSLISFSRTLGTALAKIFLEALSFSGSSGPDVPLLVKCRYFGKVVDDMTLLTFDGRRRTCYPAMINHFYLQGTFKELVTTFEATSQLLWSSSGVDLEKDGEGNKLSHNSWLLDTLQSYCRLLEYFVNSSLLLSSPQAQLLVHPLAAGLSIGLFPVPRAPEDFVRMLQSQVLDVILPVWNHPMFPNCNPGFLNSIISLVTYIYSGIGDVKRTREGFSGITSHRFVAPPPPDEATISTIVEMGFTRARAEEALRRIGTNSVEMAMEWLFNHAEDPVQEDDELARALVLSLGNSSEASKADDSIDNQMDVATESGQAKVPPVDEILTASMKLFQSDAMAFPLMDLLVTLCNRGNGEDSPKVTSYLVQQLKLCPLDFSKDTNALGVISHIIALLLFEDRSAREIAAQNGIVSVAIDILMDFKARNDSGNEVLAPKCISALLLILDNLLQSRLGQTSEKKEEIPAAAIPDSPGSSLSETALAAAKEQSSDTCEKGSWSVFDKILGRLTGYVTMEECRRILLIACDLIKQHASAIVMQAVLQLCARLTKNHALALQFLENGGMVAIFNLPRSCFFPGYDTLVSAITRHLLEDPQTLQTAMELEIRQTMTADRHGGRISPRTFLTTMASVIARDPVVFMKAASAVCQLDTFGGRTMVIISKEKEKDKSKASGAEPVSSSNEGLRVSENKSHEGPGKGSKSHRKIPANLSHVIDRLIEFVLKYPSTKSQEDCAGYLNAMEVDEPTTKEKGKSKAEDTSMTESDSLSERSADLAKVTFVLKLLSDILQMYVHTVGVVLKRDIDLCQPRGSCHQEDSLGHGGVVHHVLHHLLPLSADKTAGPDEWRDKLSEKASLFLVVLCVRSSEGRKRVIHELVKALMSFPSIGRNSSGTMLLPDRKVLAFVELVYSILSKNPSGNLPGSGFSPDVAKCMIDGGMVHCLTSILQMIDLDHPDAPKTVNFILKALESLTRAANASEQVIKPDGSNKKKCAGSIERCDEARGSQEATGSGEHIQNGNSQQENMDPAQTMQGQSQGNSRCARDHGVDNNNQPTEQNTLVEVDDAVEANPPMEINMDFMREEIEGGVLHGNGQIEMSFHVENRGDDDMGDDDDDMGDDGEDVDDDDEDGEDEDEDIAEDGAGLMSLADTDVEDHDDSGLGDEYHDEMVDDDDDDEYHENRVIEVRWREALDGLDNFQVIGQPGVANSLFEAPPEPFEGVNVDDLFGLPRALGFDRRRQSGRGASLDHSVAGAHVFQHPLLVRPSQSGELPSLWPSTGNSSRDLESVSGVDSMHFSGRRGTSDGRWTDDGQPQVGGQAAAIAQAVEEHFLSQLCSSTPMNSPENSRQPEKQPDVQPSRDGQLLGGDHSDSLQRDGQHDVNGIETPNQQNNHTDEGVSDQCAANVQSVMEESVELLQENESMPTQPALPAEISNLCDNMEIAEGNATASEELQIGPEFVAPSTESHVDVQCERSSEVIINSEGMPAHSDNCDESSRAESQTSNHMVANSDSEMSNPSGSLSLSHAAADVDMNISSADGNQTEPQMPPSNFGIDELPAIQNIPTQDGSQAGQIGMNNATPNANAIDPTFLEALPEDLRVEVLASRHVQSVQAPTYSPPSAEDIDPEFLAALPPDIQAEVLAQQRAQRVAQQADGQAVDMDNASIIATFPADLREEVLLTSSESVLSALPSPLLAEAQMLRDRAMSHYQARSLFGGSNRLINQRNGLDRQAVIDRGAGVTIGRRGGAAISGSLNVKEVEGEPLMDSSALKALIRLLRLAPPLGKGLLQRLLLNLCAHGFTRGMLVHLLIDMIKPEAEGMVVEATKVDSQRLYGCESNFVYGRAQLLNGLPPLVLRRILEILTYLATNHDVVASSLFYFDTSSFPDSLNPKSDEMKMEKGKEKIVEAGASSNPLGNAQNGDVPIAAFLKLLNRPLFLRSIAHLEQVMGLVRVIVHTAVAKLEQPPRSEPESDDLQNSPLHEDSGNAKKIPVSLEPKPNHQNNHEGSSSANPDGKRSVHLYDIFLKLPQSDLRNLCSLLGREGLSEKVYMLVGEVLKKLASVAATHRKFFTTELSDLAHCLSSSAVSELSALMDPNMPGLSAGSMAGSSLLRVLQSLSLLAHDDVTKSCGEREELAAMLQLNVALEPLWQKLSNCITSTETQLAQSTFPSAVLNVNAAGETVPGSSSSLPPLPAGAQRLLPFIEAFFVLCEKLQANSCAAHDHADVVTTREIKESSCSSFERDGDCQRRLDVSVMFGRFSEKHRRLLNAFIRQNPGLLEKSLSMMLKAPRLIDFDNKRAYFRSRIRLQHDQHLSAPLRISVRRAYILEDSYNQLRMRPTQDLKGRFNVHFQGEEGIDAGGLTREWYQLLSRVVFDKGALLFTNVGNDASFQPNPNSVFQTEHLSYFKFVGRVVAKALFDGQLLDVHFTRSFYKHILGVKVTYHDIEAVDPDYYKNLKWMLENDVSDIPDLTFSKDADEEKHILYEKGEVTDYELKPGGRNIRVTEETKHEYVDLVADHILTNAIRPQINSFLDGFGELVPRKLVSVFNDKELELLISGLPEIDLDDLKANTEYTGYTSASGVVQWFWEVVKAFGKEDMARLLQFVTGTSKVPLDGFKALQGISGTQRFQIHKAYGAPERLPSAHTCFNQLDLPEYASKQQLQERLLLAIHEASEGFGFG